MKVLIKTPLKYLRINPRVIGLITVVALTFAFATACASDPEPQVEDFPRLLLGLWQPVEGPVGTLRFQGSEASGTFIRSADGIQAESYTFQWVAPAQIRTNLVSEAGDIEFIVLFEDGGDTLVLTSVAAAEEDQIIRYSRIQ